MTVAQGRFSLLGPWSVVVVVVAFLSGCTHVVQITSNVPEAEVRVDGTPLGTVKEGATFEEPWGAARVYDIEVKAPRRPVARLQVKPNVVDVLGAPAMASAVGGCALSGCTSPLVALALYGYATNPDDIVPRKPDGSVDDEGAEVAVALWTGVLALYGCTGFSLWAVAGSQRLPDEIHVELEPMLGMDDEGLPPPPAPPTTTTPLTPPPTTTTP
ncbi:MAG: hypothetical protein Q8O67_28770 [Deltaproteobacteria bacterium]|nr:hypothetical protein [Deltaproteobacteria bacterium]